MKQKTTQLLVEYKPSACMGFTIKIPNRQLNNMLKEADKVYQKQRLQIAVG